MSWGLAHISSRELSEWMALRVVEDEEAEHRKDLADSGDGIVIEHGKEPEDDEDEDEDEDAG